MPLSLVPAALSFPTLSLCALYVPPLSLAPFISSALDIQRQFLTSWYKSLLTLLTLKHIVLVPYPRACTFGHSLRTHARGNARRVVPPANFDPTGSAIPRSHGRKVETSLYICPKQSVFGRKRRRRWTDRFVSGGGFSSSDVRCR